MKKLSYIILAACLALAPSISQAAQNDNYCVRHGAGKDKKAFAKAQKKMESQAKELTKSAFDAIIEVSATQKIEKINFQRVMFALFKASELWVNKEFPMTCSATKNQCEARENDANKIILSIMGKVTDPIMSVVNLLPSQKAKNTMRKIQVPMTDLVYKYMVWVWEHRTQIQKCK